jgi:type II secretory pathway component PulK
MMVRLDRSSGFAMLLVLWIVLALSAVALSAFLSVDTQAKITSSEREALSTEQLAHSGQQVVSYLATRGLGTQNEDLAGLPIEVVIPSFHYRIQFPSGSVEIYLESESGKINPAVAPQPVLENFFSLWTGNPNEGSRITAAIQDWQDPDSDERIDGAEASFYSDLGYVPRNAHMSFGDLALIRGLSFQDFRPSYTKVGSDAEFRYGLGDFVTYGTGGAINPNFAPELVLHSIPGLTADQITTIVQTRQQQFFGNADQFKTRVGLTSDSQALKYLSFDRGSAPAILSIAKLNGSSITRSERRVYYTFSNMNMATGRIDSEASLAFVEHNLLPEFISP